MVATCKKENSTTSLEALESFHGHLGPYVVIGAKMGDEAAARLGFKKHFGVRVAVECEDHPPQSCLVDGLQVATGATYGKRNIVLTNSPSIRVRIVDKETNRGLSFRLKAGFQEQMKKWREKKEDVTHQAELTCKMDGGEIFEIEEYTEEIKP
jgi:formylmethanofuran dehydrogenase subunit E